MNSKLVSLAKSSSVFDVIRQDLIRCGFELEFQSKDGNDDSEPDYDLLNDRATEELSNENFNDIAEITWSDYYNKTPSQLNTMIERAIEAWLDDWRERELAENPDDYYPSNQQNINTGGISQTDIEVGTDSSVSGGEIRTRGPQKPVNFLKMVDTIFSNNDLEIDRGCSFHIHLSVPGILHQYGRNMQGEMTAYLLDNIAKWPKRVISRMKSPSSRYAAIEISEEKFTCVHYHAKFKTWEFRLFGNVTGYSQAKACLFLAIEAMRHAYRVKLGLSKPLFTTAQALSAVVQPVLHDQIPLKKAAKTVRVGNYVSPYGPWLTESMNECINV